MITSAAVAAALLWLALLLLPWRPWRIGETLEARRQGNADLGDVTVLIPARNEAATLGSCLHALAAQGHGLKIVVIDDQSSDDTARIAAASGAGDLTVLTGAPLPPGWSGKLWALEQGRAVADRRLTLLLDADIALAPGTLAALRGKLETDNLELASLMAAPPLHGFGERLLLPAYVYFFMLLYPFRLANKRGSRMAAAAGGCILLETRLLEAIGGFAALRDALIDDCALAGRIKQSGGRTWIGLTHSARMLRRQRLKDIWSMVARTAFTQLRYSPTLLGLCTLLMVLAYGVPAAALTLGAGAGRVAGAAGCAAMIMAYLPTLRFYRRSPLWAPALPLIAALYLAMTWNSAWRYWHGQRSQWKDRVYLRIAQSDARE